MVQPSPDTRIVNFHESYPWAAGYRYEDAMIRGFSQTHFSGTGHSDLGDFLLMPIAGAVKLDGNPLARIYITQSEIEHGGVLRFTMQAQPDMHWATAANARPYSMSPYPVPSRE